jgi:hypothetical protein
MNCDMLSWHLDYPSRAQRFEDILLTIETIGGEATTYQLRLESLLCGTLDAAAKKSMLRNAVPPDIPQLSPLSFYHL